MANDTTVKKPRAKRRNYELEMRTLRNYIETKLELLREGLTDDPIDAITLAKIATLDAVLSRLMRGGQ
jgi:hypothetical protein